MVKKSTNCSLCRLSYYETCQRCFDVSENIKRKRGWIVNETEGQVGLYRELEI